MRPTSLHRHKRTCAFKGSFPAFLPTVSEYAPTIPLYVCIPFPDSSHCISHKLVSNVWTVFEVFSAARRLWLSFHCSNLHLVLFHWVAEKEEYKNHILSFYFLKQPNSAQSNSHILKLAVCWSGERWRKSGVQVQVQVQGSYLLYGIRRSWKMPVQNTLAARTLGADTVTLISLINAFAQIVVTQSSTPTSQIHTPPASMP